MDYFPHGAYSLQFAIYAKGQHYVEHMDTFFHEKKQPQRKLSVSVLLNDGFEGGALVVDGCRVDFSGTGMALLFPSIMNHRVEPVTEGCRLSLVAWYYGPPWR